MDTLTHALSGALVGRLLAARAGANPPSSTRVPAWQAVAAGAAAAAFPDIDFVLGYVSELTYLRGHRGITHSLLLLPLWGMLLATLFARLARRRDAQWRDFLAVACGGILIHILGDLITQFGTMILAPFSDRRFGWGTTFIIDLPLSGLLAAGLIAGAVWRRSKVPAAAALSFAVAWIGVGAVGRGEAIAAAQLHALAHGIPALAVDAAPRPLSPFNWTAIIYDGERYHYAHINTRRSEVLEASPDDPLFRRLSAPYRPVRLAHWETATRFGDGGTAAFAQSVWESPDFEFFRWFAMFPVLDHVGNSSSGMPCAGFRDLRFEIPGRDETPFRFGLCGLTDGMWQLYRLAAKDGSRILLP